MTRSDSERATKRRTLQSGCRRILADRRAPATAGYPRDRGELETSLSDNRACRQYLERLIWPGGFECPACGAASEPWRTSTGLMACRACQHAVMIERGTILQRPSAPLHRWFALLWEVADGGACMNVAHVREILGLNSDEAAAACLRSIRELMGLDQRGPLGGVVELGRACLELPGMVLDESSLLKGLVAIAIEQEGSEGQLGEVGPLRIQHLAKRDTSDGLAFAASAITAGSEVRTIAWNGYERLADAGYRHRIRPAEHAASAGIDHSASLLEMWLWTQPDVDWNNLQGHLDEFTFRFNHRFQSCGAVFQRLLVTALNQGDTRVAVGRDELLRSA
ncbi:MAG: IS1595 family transposase [Deltaproteobacteria bacterium]|nr:IS1595 family transposase [Deltaproteobacteria bacterium]